MHRYYLNINRQDIKSRGNYELHKASCIYCHSEKTNFTYIGTFDNDFIALLTAKRMYSKIANYIDGCYYCCSAIDSK